MNSLIFTKHYNLLMIASLMLVAWGFETALDDHWLIGLLMIVAGFAAYLASDRSPPDPSPAPLPAKPPEKVHPLLMPIEWDAVFDEPIPPIPTTLPTAMIKPDTRL